MSAVRRQGIRGTAQLIAETISARCHERFDRVHGVETTRYVKLARLGFDAEDQRLSRDYSATPVRTLRALLSHLRRDVRFSTFIDFGSGKGRALLVASEFGFQRIVGVEFSKELHEIAERNLRSYRGRKQRCFALSCVCERAEEFRLPDGDLVLYFFNPFEPEVMERVLQNVSATWEKTPRKIYLLFYRMRFRPVVERFGIFREVVFRRLPFDPARPSGYDAAIFFADPKR
jgi:SAM-dependent methyltransferase